MPEMAFKIERDGADAVLTWEPPAGTRQVDCAHFVCLPEFSASGSMMTFDRCVVAYTKFPAGQRSVALSRLGEPPSDVAAGPVSLPGVLPRGSGVPSPTTIAERSVAGCWAYNSYKLVGATRLLGVELSGTRGEKLIAAKECPSDGGLQACKLGSNSDAVLGICLQGRCRPRCTSNRDCNTERAVVFDASAIAIDGGDSGDSGQTTSNALPDPCSLECLGVDASSDAAGLGGCQQEIELDAGTADAGNSDQ